MNDLEKVEKKIFNGKRVLVTGACGTVGTELIRQLVSNPSYNPKEIIGIDNNESGLFFLDQEHLAEPRANFAIADVRDLRSLSKHFEDVDIVFHTAALKHVVMTEKTPQQAVLTNVNGVQNVIDACYMSGVETAIFTSSDKAVNPTSVMGTSKLMGERLMTAANSNRKGLRPVFSSTRFGNVLGSSGSVFPIFRSQIKKGGPITITDENMTRFIMSIEASVKLIIDSAYLAKGGEIFITKMPVVKISDLARAMVEIFAPIDGVDPFDVDIEIIGTKPGEKLYEELMSEEETRRAVELEAYFSVLPAFRGVYQRIDYSYDDIVNERVLDPYVSEKQPHMEVINIVRLLKEWGLCEMQGTDQIERYWPGDKHNVDDVILA